MDSVHLKVNMLGGFSVRTGAAELNDSDNRSRKVWLLLAYMIYCRNRPVTLEELVDLLWGDAESSSNPLNALKTMFHRVRAVLNQLGGDMGHTLIIRRDGSYAWNPEIPFSLDVDEFEATVRAGDQADAPAQKLEIYLSALSLYQGDFLPKLSSNPWVIPISAYFHNLYLRTLQEVLPMLEAQQRLQEAIEVAQKGLEIDPYCEPVYQHLMRDLLAQGRAREVILTYEDMSKLLFSDFGVMPSEESLSIYRSATRTTNDRTVTLVTVQEQLREAEPPCGALFCDYDFFKAICKAEARALLRSGSSVHLCMITVTGEHGKELSRRSLDCCMENLRQLICSNLRKGDIASRCSISQYVLMLPQANYENSCRICERIVKAFSRQYPHSPARLHFSVQPLEPQ